VSLHGRRPEGKKGRGNQDKEGHASNWTEKGGKEGSICSTKVLRRNEKGRVMCAGEKGDQVRISLPAGEERGPVFDERRPPSFSSAPASGKGAAQGGEVKGGGTFPRKKKKSTLVSKRKIYERGGKKRKSNSY